VDNTKALVGVGKVSDSTTIEAAKQFISAIQHKADLSANVQDCVRVHSMLEAIGQTIEENAQQPFIKHLEGQGQG